MKRIIELHEQAAEILSKAQDCITEISYINEDTGSIENKEELKQVYLRAYRMAMRSYFRIIRRIQEIGDGTEW